LAIEVNLDNDSFVSVDGVLFDKSQRTLIQFPGGARNYTIPDSVASIGGGAFAGCGLTNVTIPNNVTTIGSDAFAGCTKLTAVALANGVTSIGASMFSSCISLINVTIPNSVSTIGGLAFYDCQSLTSITLPNNVTNIGGEAFSYCLSLRSVYFQGNAPAVGYDAFCYQFLTAPQGFGWGGCDDAIVYYLPGTSGWTNSSGFAEFAEIGTALWLPQIQTTNASVVSKTNQFGFSVNWASGTSIVVEASPSLSNPVWSPVATNTVNGGTLYFTDPQWTKYPSRFYRVRSQ
jgi:hypothetical protein